MISFDIQGLAACSNSWRRPTRAFSELQGEIATISLNPADQASVDTAILDIERAIDLKMARFDRNEIVSSMIANMKAQYRDNILAQASAAAIQTVIQCRVLTSIKASCGRSKTPSRICAVRAQYLRASRQEA